MEAAFVWAAIKHGEETNRGVGKSDSEFRALIPVSVERIRLFGHVPEEEEDLAMVAYGDV